MNVRRLRAPSVDGGVLAMPPLDQAGSLCLANAARLGNWTYDFQGRRADWLRPFARRQVVNAAREFLSSHGVSLPTAGDSAGDSAATAPLVLTGHQPELFHPGVWIKNFATAALARTTEGVGLNLIVDNDHPRSSSIRVPQIQGGRARMVRVEFDQWKGEAPYEDLHVHDEATFATFGNRVREALAGAAADPLIGDFWPLAVRRTGELPILGLRLALARRELEGAWNVSNLEVPLSRVCQTEGFLWFASHILAQLPRFQETYNTALAEYRALYRIRSKNHPVSALTTQGEWREAPFWVWRQGNPRRQALLVRQGPRTMDLRIADEDQILTTLPLAPDREACCAVDQLRELESRSIRFRTRALTTTLFSRYLLGDLFIHGIGGAKYDELGDIIAKRFFGIEPPGFLTLSMTLWPELPAQPLIAPNLASVDRELRDLTYNPDRHVTEPTAEIERNLIEAKRRMIAEEPATKREKIARFRELRRLNAALQPVVEAQARSLRAQRDQLLRALDWNRVVRNREYAFVLYSAQRLRDAIMQFMRGRNC